MGPRPRFARHSPIEGLTSSENSERLPPLGKCRCKNLHRLPSLGKCRCINLHRLMPLGKCRCENFHRLTPLGKCRSINLDLIFPVGNTHPQIRTSSCQMFSARPNFLNVDAHRTTTQASGAKRTHFFGPSDGPMLTAPSKQCQGFAPSSIVQA